MVDWLFGCLTLPLCVQTVGGFSGFCCLLSKSLCRQFHPHPHCLGCAWWQPRWWWGQPSVVCVCVRVIVVVVQPTVWARTGAAQSVDGIVCLFVCSLWFLADLWLVSCVIHEVASILSVRCMCV